MRSIAVLSAVTVLALAVPFAHGKMPEKKDSANAIVIVFKDGHRQTFNLADISRVEFTGTGAVPGVSSNPEWPAHGRYVGKWAVGDGNGNSFTITLREDGNAMRSIGDIHGTWTYVNGDALINWDDGAKDAIRRAGSGFEKYAYSHDKSFGDEPDNVTKAQNTTPRPI
ncbi:MAG TPA: hypothetical protein VHW46_08520 [Terracidiphilus sp.]|jgi:hypothetical protein|nr:hypothetical protein [Terracidiphilus sp.]